MPEFVIQTASNMFEMRSGGGADTNYSNQTLMRIGNNAGILSRGIGRFDFSTLPVGIISKAVLSLYCVALAAYPNSPLGHGIGVYRVVPTTVSLSQFTWNIYKTAATWWIAGASHSGSDYVITNYASGLIPDVGNWLNIDVLAQVQYAQVSTGKIALFKVNTEEDYNHYADWYSSVYATDTTKRPKLTITYFTPQIMIF